MKSLMLLRVTYAGKEIGSDRVGVVFLPSVVCTRFCYTRPKGLPWSLPWLFSNLRKCYCIPVGKPEGCLGKWPVPCGRGAVCMKVLYGQLLLMLKTVLLWQHW